MEWYGIETIFCPMDFSWYPYDDQVCEQRIGLYAFESKANKTVLRWISHRDYEDDLDSPITNIPDWIVADYGPDPKSNGTKTLVFAMEFHRLVSTEILHTFVPSIMLCLTSASSVFIKPEHMPARMGLCITTFLSMISLFKGSKYIML